MQDAMGMLTAFPKGDFADRYYLEAASSSVATAISVLLPASEPYGSCAPSHATAFAQMQLSAERLLEVLACSARCLKAGMTHCSRGCRQLRQDDEGTAGGPAPHSTGAVPGSLRLHSPQRRCRGWSRG